MNWDRKWKKLGILQEKWSKESVTVAIRWCNAGRSLSCVARSLSISYYWDHRTVSGRYVHSIQAVVGR